MEQILTYFNPILFPNNFVYGVLYTIFGDIWIYLTKFDKVAYSTSNTKPRCETGFIEGGRWQARTADLCRVKATTKSILSRVNQNFSSYASTESVSTMWV